MFASDLRSRKRPVNLTLSEVVVAQARTYTENLSATVDGLLSEYVRSKQHEAKDHQRSANACAQTWNDFHARVGSFADEHSTL